MKKNKTFLLFTLGLTNLLLLFVILFSVGKIVFMGFGAQISFIDSLSGTVDGHLIGLTFIPSFVKGYIFNNQIISILFTTDFAIGNLGAVALRAMLTLLTVNILAIICYLLSFQIKGFVIPAYIFTFLTAIFAMMHAFDYRTFTEFQSIYTIVEMVKMFIKNVGSSSSTQPFYYYRALIDIGFTMSINFLRLVLALSSLMIPLAMLIFMVLSIVFAFKGKKKNQEEIEEEPNLEPVVEK